MRATRLLVSVLAAWLLCGTPRALAGQDALVARRGDRVRVRVDTTSAVFAWHVGTLSAVRPETLVVRPCFRCARESYARANVRALEVSVGRPHHAGLGVALGAVAGAASVAISIRQCEKHERGEGPPCGIGATGLPIAAIVGAMGGGLVGSFVHAGPERWWPARLAAPAR